MNINPYKMSHIFETSDVYDVPSYQRDYKWDSKEIKIMMQDLFDFSMELKQSNKDKIYYFGNIITQKTPTGTTESERASYYLIDGQQRLTTFYLLYKALLTIQFNLDIANGKNVNNLKSTFDLYFKSKNGEKFKLLNKNDSLQNFIYNTNSLDKKNKNISENYEIIYSELNSYIKNEEQMQLWKRVIENIMLGKLELTEDQNAELIFENINSKGKILTLSELIKNKLFLKNNLLKKSLILNSKSTEEQNDIEESNNEIEKDIIEIFRKIDLDQDSIFEKNINSSIGMIDFKIEDYLRVITSFVFRCDIKSEDHLAFMDIRKIIDSYDNQDEFHNLIKRFGSTIYYLHILNAFISKRQESSIYIKWLINKSPSLIIILLYAIESLFKNSILTKENVVEDVEDKILNIFKDLFKLAAKASIYSDGFLGINLWKAIPNSIVLNEQENIDIELTILKLIKMLKNDSENSEESGVELEEENIEATLEEEFVKKVPTYDFYRRDRILAKYLLMLIEKNKEIESNSYEPKTWNNIIEKLDSSNWTIEHIIPQKINPSTKEGKLWLDDLGAFDYMSQMDKIGNLSMTSSKMNTAMKNFEFSRKKLKFAESGLLINSEISNLTKFGEEEYKDRSKILSDLIINLLN